MCITVLFAACINVVNTDFLVCWQFGSVMPTVQQGYDDVCRIMSIYIYILLSDKTEMEMHALGVTVSLIL